MEGYLYLPAFTIYRIHRLMDLREDNPGPDVNRKACPPYFWRLFRTRSRQIGLGPDPAG